MTRGSPKEWRAAIHAALLAGAATVALPAAARPTSAAAFAPPSESPLLLSRKVVREISGGTAIVATRRYRVTFHENGDGWVIRGDLVASEIDAPPALAAIAAIERNRPDEGLFPIYLDSSGLIVPAPAPPDMGREAVAAAVDLARQGGGDASATASGFIGKVAAAARSPGGGLTR